MKKLDRNHWRKLKDYVAASDCPIDISIHVALLTGCRASEVIRIKPSDIVEGKVKIKASKNSKDRSTTLPAKLVRQIKQLPENVPIISAGTSAISVDSKRKIIDRRLKSICHKLRIPEVGLHTLRHTICSELYETTKDILLVKDFIGHKSINSTMVYLHYSNTKKAEAQISQLLG